MPAEKTSSGGAADGKNGEKDVEMGDVTLAETADAAAPLSQVIAAELKSIAEAVPGVDLRALGRLQLAAIKRRISGNVLRRCVEVYVGDDEIKGLLSLLLAKEVQPLPEELEKALSAGKTSNLLEVAFFFAILTLDWALTQGTDCKKFVSQLVARLARTNRRTMDFFASRVYGIFARVFKDSELIRNDLLAIYRTACLRKDFATQATVLNLTLRNYLQHNLFDQANQLVSKTTFPENRTNAEYARYLFYIGRIRSISLEYSEAHSKLMQAIRKAPQNPTKAVGFKVQAWKFALTVELLMGEIPERNKFTQKGLYKYLRPYEEVAKAVHGGSVPQFEAVVQKYRPTFVKDCTWTLINRLRYNVIKVGLRKINVAYSRISLQDICQKLGLDSVEDAAGICAKAISDGVIQAKLDYEENALLSRANADIFLTSEPQQQLHKRIAFCLQLHAETVKAMEYPQKKEVVDDDEDPTKDAKERDAILAEVSDEDIDML